VERVQPEGVIHLAGFSSVAKSHQNPPQAFAVNALGTVNLLSALREHAPRARVSSSALARCTGRCPGRNRLGALAAAAHQPLCASKAAAEQAGFQFFKSYGLPVVSARPFNHLGAGQQPHFVVPSSPRRSRHPRGDAQAVLKVATSNPSGIFSHVDDVVEAYALLLERGVPGEAYNVAADGPAASAASWTSCWRSPGWRRR